MLNMKLNLNMQKPFKKAFTLAEVLITLAIIGVVAALTIPALMTKIQDMQFKQAAKEYYSKASQVVQQIKNDEGTLSDFVNNADNSYFGSVFKSYFKVSNDCSPACVQGTATSDVYKTLYGSKAATQGYFSYEFVTMDGVLWSYGNHNIITVDVNGYLKGPNTYGRDVFMFQIVNENLVPLGSLGTYHPQYYCTRDFENGAGQQGTGCMDYVMRGVNY